MVNAIANPNLAGQSSGPVPSPASSLLNSAASTNGAPTFAGAVHSALNTPSAYANQSPASNPKASEQGALTPVPSGALQPSTASTSAVPVNPTKRISKPQDASGTPPAQNSAALPNQILFAPLVIAVEALPQMTPPAVAPPTNGNSASSSPAVTSPDPAGTAAALNAAAPDVSPVASLVNPQVPSDAAAFLALPQNPETQSSSPSPVSPTSDSHLTVVTPGPTTSGQLSAQLTNALDATLTTNAFNTSASAAPGPSQAATPAARIVVASTGVGASYGQVLSSDLQQFQDLLASTGTISLSSSGVSELTRAGSQSLAPAADHYALPGAAEHTSGLLSSVEGSLSKDLQSAQTQTHASQPTASAAVSATAGTHSAQNSSSDASQQNGSDSSGSSGSSNSTDSSPTNSPLAKPLLAGFSDALATNATSRLAAPQPAPASAASPVISAPPSADSASRPAAAEPLPSAPAQAAQPSLPTLHAPDTTVGRFVNDAELSNAANQSEIRIALQTDKLGAIELRAHVTGDELGAAIIVEKRDAHAALAVELPALQQTLSEKQLRVDQVVLTQGSLHSTAGDAGANAQQGQRGGGSQAFRQNSSYANESMGLQQAAWFVPEAVGIYDSQGRLSVQA